MSFLRVVSWILHPISPSKRTRYRVRIISNVLSRAISAYTRDNFDMLHDLNSEVTATKCKKFGGRNG